MVDSQTDDKQTENQYKWMTHSELKTSFLLMLLKYVNISMDFFINVGPTLSKNIPPQDSNASDFIVRLDHTLYLFPTDAQELETIIKCLNNSSAGWDDISPSVLKYVAPHISKVLVLLINSSFQEGVFPNELQCDEYFVMIHLNIRSSEAILYHKSRYTFQQIRIIWYKRY